MENTIKDGTGSGFEAKVDSVHRLYTNAVTKENIDQAIYDGYGYNISTGAITLTNATESGLLFLKNTGDLPLVVKVIGYAVGATTGGGTNPATFRLYAGISETASTLVTGALAVTANQNRNLGSTRSLDGVTYKGVQGATVTGGVSAGVSSRSDFSSPFRFEDAIFVLPKGTSIAATFQPPTGNTSQTVTVFCTCFYEQNL